MELEQPWSELLKVRLDVTVAVLKLIAVLTGVLITTYVLRENRLTRPTDALRAATHPSSSSYS